MRKLTVMTVVLLFSAGVMNAATFVAGTPYNTVLQVGEMNCLQDLYDPDVFLNAAGDLSVHAMGNDSVSTTTGSCTNGMDSIYRSVRNKTTGVWTNTAEGACPIVTIPSKCDHLAGVSEPGPTASPSVLRIPRWGGFPGGKYYMAFSGGNGDFERGRVYWADSDDGVNWNVMRDASGNPIELIAPAELTKGDCDRHGISQLEVKFDPADGYLYFFLHYLHERAGYTTSEVMYRINYNPYATFGLGSTRQVHKWNSNTWVASDGKLRFTYDYSTADALIPYQWARNYQWEGDIVFIPSRNRWVHFYTVAGRTLWNETLTSSLNSDWTNPQDVNVDTIKNLYGIRYNQEGGVAVWEGDLTNDNVSNPRLYIFVPVRQLPECTATGVYYSMGVIIAPLDYI